MRVVVHVGMPKTGSTAIQASFHGLRSPALEYLEASGINHYGHLTLLYGAPGEGHRVFWPGGGQAARVEERRAEARRALGAQLARLAATNGTLVVSSEALWSRERAALRRALVDDLTRPGLRVEALAYLRAPVSQAVSAFQQRLKHLDVPPEFGLRPVWPRFRPHLTSLDQSFGPSAVALRPFRAGEGDFDVVADFAAAIGVDAPAPPPRGNASLSAEAIAVLYAARRRVPRIRIDSRARHRAALSLLDGLRSLGVSRLSFAKPLWRPLAVLHADDASWAEDRLGEPFREEPARPGVVIAAERDLLDLADAHAASDQAQALAEGLDRLAADDVRE